MTTTEQKLSTKEVLKECEVKGTELCYVTSVDKASKTFFAQLCKNSNDDLTSFNYTIYTYCQNIVAERKAGEKRKGRPKIVNVGDVLCAKYPIDERWYRATVISVDTGAKSCLVKYLDYGNNETVTFRQLIEVNPKDFPTMAREPFGVTCSILEEPEDEQDWSNFFDALEKKYLMLKMKALGEDGTWKISIPKHGYNVPFWTAYKPELYPNKFRNSDEAILFLDD